MSLPHSASTRTSDQSKNFAQSVFLVLFFIGLLVYLPTFNAPFHFDDKLTIARNPGIREPWRLDLIWQTFNTRFVPGVTFALNFFLSGFTPFSYHVFNFIIHLTNAWLVFCLVQGIGQTPYALKRWADFDWPRLGFLAALIFITHPVQTEAISFLTQRYTALAATFSLLTAVLFFKARLQNHFGSFLAALLTCLLAMFCKEHTVTLPLLLLLLDFALLKESTQKAEAKQLPVWVFLLLLPVIPLTLTNTGQGTIHTARIANIQMDKHSREGNVDITRATWGELSRHEYFLTQLNVIVTYLRLYFLPINQNLDYDYPIVKNWRDPKTIGCGLLIVGLGVLAVKFWSSARLIAVGILWFFISLSVESSVIPIGHVIAEYRLYFPILGLILATIFILAILIRFSRVYLLVAFALVGVLAIIANQRNVVWSSEIRLWEDVVVKSPRKSRPHINLALAYSHKGKWDQAIEHLKWVEKYDPSNSFVTVNLGFIYSAKGETELAIDYLERTIKLNPQAVEAYVNLGAIYGDRKEFVKEITLYEQALKVDPRQEEIYVNLGITYVEMKNFPAAQQQVLKLLELKRSDLAHRLEQFILQAEKETVFPERF